MENNLHNQDCSVDNKFDKNENDINLGEIVEKIWSNRNFVIKITLVFIIIGFIVAISTPNIYTASCTMVPQTGEKKASGSLSGLAAMAGINLGSLSSSEILSPSVYPIIFSNINFQKDLIYSKYHFIKTDSTITLFEYYTNEKYRKFSLFGKISKYTIGLPGVIIKSIKGKSMNIAHPENSNIKSLTEDERDVLKIVNENLSLDINSKEGYVSITVNMTEPLLAAELAQKGQELLQKYITEFKIEKVTQNLEFVKRNYEEGKTNFESKQSELARFRDANKSFSSAVAKTQEEKLTSEYNLLLGIYTELAKQKEQAKIAVTETTPILTIIKPVVIPIDKSKPNRTIILLLFSLFGVISSSAIILIVKYLEENFNLKKDKYWFIPKII